MTREAALSGFYNTLIEIKGLEVQGKEKGNFYNIKLIAAKLKIKIYAYSLVYDHGWQDVHTVKYFKKEYIHNRSKFC